jgi:ribosomal protein S6
MPTEYELTYLSDPNLEDERRRELEATIDAEITNLGGAILGSLPSSRKRLSYPIKKQAVAFLRLLNLQLDPAQTNNLRSFLHKQKDLLRFTFLATPPQTEITPDLLFKSAAESAKPSPKLEKKSDKKVTMAEVEEGIEEILKEEIK